MFAAGGSGAAATNLPAAADAFALSRARMYPIEFVSAGGAEAAAPPFHLDFFFWLSSPSPPSLPLLVGAVAAAAAAEVVLVGGAAVAGAGTGAGHGVGVVVRAWVRVVVETSEAGTGTTPGML